MTNRWAGDYENRILKLLPSDGSKVRAQRIFNELMKHPRKGETSSPSSSSSTIQKYLGRLETRGEIKRIQKSHKEVYYKRCEDVRLRHLIEEFTKEVETSLAQLSIRDRESALKRRNLPMSELDELLNDETQLRSWVLFTVIRKIHNVIGRTLFSTLPKLEFYVGVIGGTVRIIPKQTNYDWSRVWEPL
jgi:Fe2+ or Zn2+ uptake regulation protein